MARKEATNGAAPPQDPGVLDEMGGGSQLPATRSSAALGEVSGETNFADMRLPRLQLVHGTSKIAVNFSPGDWVLASDNLLVHKGEPLKVILLTARKYWKEYLSQEMYAAGARPRVFETAKEVLAANGTIEWKNGVGPTFSQAIDLRMFIEQPKDLVCGLFGVPIGGKTYAPAIWTADKTAFKRVEPVVTSAASFSLRIRKLYSGVFTLMSKIEKIGKSQNPTAVPALALTGHLSDGEIEELKALFAGMSTAEEAEPGDTPEAGSEL